MLFREYQDTTAQSYNTTWYHISTGYYWACVSPSSLPAADGSPPGGCTGRPGRMEGMKHLMHALVKVIRHADLIAACPSLDNRSHHETLVNQCNISPVTGLVRFCMPDEARDGQNVALIDKCFMVCSIVQRRIKLPHACTAMHCQ